MSVLSWNRTTSKMEFINVALQIYEGTLRLTTRLSARYARVFGGRLNDLAAKLVEEAETANSIFPSDAEAKRQRKWHLREARGALMGLSVQLTMAYRILMECPEGAFVKIRPHRPDGSRGGPEPLARDSAIHRLDQMAEDLGLRIDRENDLLKGAISALR